jgi:hypothetical protein
MLPHIYGHISPTAYNDYSIQCLEGKLLCGRQYTTSLKKTTTHMSQ